MAHCLRLVHGRKRLSQLPELSAQRYIHLTDEMADNIVKPFQLSLCLRRDKVVHTLADRHEGTLYRLADTL
ncbi:hypothetical protein SDC9_159836 [bioreactor metagenome]|uniref:Uncharacterized protein n=1 Tax=bioreactor metagenome TaxID=1076179 RepID=A0A645FDP3_9ZZZZ